MPATTPLFVGEVDLEIELFTPVMTERALMIPGMESRGSAHAGVPPGPRCRYDLIEVVTVAQQEVLVFSGASRAAHDPS